MANKRILKLTNTEANVKVDGAVGPITIDLDVDLVKSNEVATGTQAVNIVSILASGAPGGLITFTRNSEILYSVSTDTISEIDLQGFGGLIDPTHNTHDIVVTTSVAECQCIIKLRKVDGYSSKIETAEFGVYDNPDAVGS